MNMKKIIVLLVLLSIGSACFGSIPLTQNENKTTTLTVTSNAQTFVNYANGPGGHMIIQNLSETDTLYYETNGAAVATAANSGFILPTDKQFFPYRVKNTSLISTSSVKIKLTVLN